MGVYKLIALLDMDSYFASIECAKNPVLRNRPIAVIGTGEKTVITSANYLARSYGVKTGMNIKEARMLCPKIIFLKADFPYYELTTLKIAQIIEKYFPVYKEASIDEFYIALDSVDSPIKRLEMLKNEIYEKLSLKCTIGVGCNPHIAKTACEVSKPDGFLVVDDIDSFSKSVDISKVLGIGKSSKKLLDELGVQTLWELLHSKDCETLDILKMSILKTYTESEFFKIELPKSMGHILTLDRSINSFNEIVEIGKYLLFGLYAKLVRYKMGTKYISTYLKLSNGNFFSTSKSVGSLCNDYILLSKIIEQMYRKLYLSGSVVKIGVSLQQLKYLDGFQSSLFWEDTLRKFEKITQIKDIQLGGFYVLKSKKVVG